MVSEKGGLQDHTLRFNDIPFLDHELVPATVEKREDDELHPY